MNLHTLRLAMNVILLTIGLILCLEYWETEQFSAIKQVSVPIMILVIMYIALQVIKRLIYKKINWWDWIYYIALISIVLPVFFANSANENVFHWILDIGSFFFILPILIDSYYWLNERKKT